MNSLSSVSAGALAALIAAAPAAFAQESIPAGQPHTAQGRLEASDPKTADEHPYDEYRLRLTAGQRIRLFVESEEIDPMVRVHRAGETGEALAENDDHGESLNSRLSFAAPEEGEYLVRVLSFAPETLGGYTLRAEPLSPLPAPVTAHGGTTRTRWRTFEGSLGADDPDDGGMHFDDYLIALRQGEQVIVRLDSAAFDPVVRIMTAQGRDGPEIEADDDTGPGVNSLLGFEAPQAGDYIVRVTSYGEGETGAYTLRVGADRRR